MEQYQGVLYHSGSHGEEQEQAAEGTAWKPFSENLIKN